MKKNKNKAQKAKKPHTLLISVKQNKELAALYFILRLVIIFIFTTIILKIIKIYFYNFMKINKIKKYKKVIDKK